MPVKLGAPLLAWDSLTLEELWKVELPAAASEGTSAAGAAIKTASGRYEGIAGVLFEYLDLCVDWDRVIVPGGSNGGDKTSVGEEEKRDCVKKSLELLVAAAIRSGESKEVKEEVDKERSGIAMWRIP